MESTLSQDWRRDHDYQKVYDYLHDFVGVSRKQKLMDDLSRYLLQQKVHWASKNNVLPSMEAALVLVENEATHEIEDLGGTLPGDLFVDQYGTLRAGEIVAPGLEVVVSLSDTGGAPRNVIAITSSNAQHKSWNNPSASSINTGSQIQIGSGVTAPTRADVAIETAFGTAPESGLFNTGSGSYAVGAITFSGSISSGGAGTINEALYAIALVDSGGTQRKVAACHDATTATAFIAGKSITVQYSISD